MLDICSLIDSSFTVHEYKGDYTLYFQRNIEPCIFIFGNAMNEKNNTIQIKASTELLHRQVISFLDVNTTLLALAKTAF